MAMQTTTVALADLIEDPQNLRAHPDNNIAALCASLAEFGQPEPLVVRKQNNVVISGNGRLVAMRKLGWSDAQVVYVGWDDDRARAYSLVANRTGETSTWKDHGELMMEVERLGDTVDISQMGFDDDFFSDMSARAEHMANQAVEQHNSAPSEKPKQGKPIQLTKEQRAIFDEACARVRQSGSEDYSEGRCLELMAAEYMAGA